MHSRIIATIVRIEAKKIVIREFENYTIPVRAIITRMFEASQSLG